MSFDLFVWSWIAMAVGTLVLLFFVSAPYGRHIRKGWGPTLDHRIGWFLMECTSLFIFSYFFFEGALEKNWISYFFASLWILHYVNRALIYPLRQKGKRKEMPVAIALFGFLFNCVNGYFNGHFLGTIAHYDLIWVQSPWFVGGVVLFFFGVAINLWADEKLFALKRQNKDYQNPRGGLYEFISCPNYLGEIVEWLGFALMTLSLPALSFFIWTVANLAPRALAHNKWYREQFGDEPKGRKALFPFIF